MLYCWLFSWWWTWKRIVQSDLYTYLFSKFAFCLLTIVVYNKNDKITTEPTVTKTVNGRFGIAFVIRSLDMERNYPCTMCTQPIALFVDVYHSTELHGIAVIATLLYSMFINTIRYDSKWYTANDIRYDSKWYKIQRGDKYSIYCHFVKCFLIDWTDNNLEQSWDIIYLQQSPNTLYRI
jgi:hypothetical protein